MQKEACIWKSEGRWFYTNRLSNTCKRNAERSMHMKKWRQMILYKTT